MSNTHIHFNLCILVQECLESEERKLVKAIKVKDNTDIEGRLNKILDKLRKS